jgi:hypothetical protein
MLCPNIDAAIGVSVKIPAASPAAHDPVHHQHRDHALDYLRQRQRPGVVAEDPRRQHLREERPGQLVQRLMAVQGAVQEALPAM